MLFGHRNEFLCRRTSIWRIMCKILRLLSPLHNNKCFVAEESFKRNNSATHCDLVVEMSFWVGKHLYEGLCVTLDVYCVLCTTTNALVQKKISKWYNVATQCCLDIEMSFYVGEHPYEGLCVKLDFYCLLCATTNALLQKKVLNDILQQHSVIWSSKWVSM